MSGEPPPDLQTPWHWVVVPTSRPHIGALGRAIAGSQAGPLARRLEDANPAVYAILSRHPTSESWDAALQTLVDQGATDDEVWAGDWLAMLPIPIRRYLPARLAELRGSPARRERLAPIATSEQAAAAYGELRSEREAARRLRISKTQLRRLLGKED